MNKIVTNYTEGDVYFRIVYPDAELSIPIIQSFVFVGINLSDEDDEDTWYFQFADDYAKHGNFLESEHNGCKVCCVTHTDLSSMLDISELASQLESAKIRSSTKPRKNASSD